LGTLDSIPPPGTTKGVYSCLIVGGSDYDIPAVATLREMTSKLDLRMDSTGSIELHVEVPGPVWGPKRAGIVLGRFKKKWGVVPLSIPVPNEIAQSEDRSVIGVFLLKAVRHGLELAMTKFAKAKLSFDKPTFESHLQRIEAEWRLRPPT
jgi:hypothetical protein